MSVFTEIKERVSFVDLAREYGIRLKKNGSHYICLCPFHSEKTPSMVLYKDGYKCFGCGEAGDAISFVSKLQGLKPFEACKDIIHQCGLPIEMDKPVKPKRKKQYSQADFLKVLEAWRDETFPVYVSWYKTINDALQGMTVEMMEIPGFKALVEMMADLDYITEQLISDRFEDVYKAFRFTQGTKYELQEAVKQC
jgi:hypothetical protein